MTGQLTDLMHERADRLEPPDVDIERLVREGDKRVRRRRTALVGGVAALAVAAAMAIPALVGGGTATTGRDPEPVAPGISHEVSWATGGTIHFGNRSVDVGRTVRSYVVTDGGAVFSDPDGAVWSVVGTDVARIGHVAADYAYLVSDGSRAAWVEPRETPVFVVFDQVTGDTVRDSLQNTAGMSYLTGARISAVLYALDGPVAYVKSGQAAVAWDTGTGAHQVLDPDVHGFGINDAQAGLIAYVTSDYPPVHRVGTDLQSGTSLDVEHVYSLSPGGRYLIGAPEPEDIRIYDTSTGAAMPKDDYGYAYFYGYQWLDDAHFAALGFDSMADDAPMDVLTCAAATGRCTVAADDAGSKAGGFNIPLG